MNFYRATMCQMVSRYIWYLCYEKLNCLTKLISAKGFGVKEIMPAYLDPNLHPQDLITGVSFASGACGYDPLTSKIAVSPSLSLPLLVVAVFV